MKEIVVNFKHWKCNVVFGRYQQGEREAFWLEEVGTGDRVAYCTINEPLIELEDHEFLIKNYSENEGMLEALVESGIVEDTGKFYKRIFPTHEIIVPIVRIKGGQNE